MTIYYFIYRLFKTPKTHVIGLILCMLYYPAFASPQSAIDKQTNSIDSLTLILKTSKVDTNRVNILNELSYKLNYSNVESAEEYAIQAIDIGNKLNFNKGILRSYYNLGLIYKNIGKFDLAIVNCHKSIEICRIIGDSSGVASSLNTIGTVNYYLGNYSEALIYYQKALSIYKQLNLQSREATMINNIGLVYSVLSKYSEALDYYFRSLKIQEEQNNKEGVALTLANIGIIYFNLGDAPKALEYYEKSLKTRLELNDDFGIAQCYSNMGNVYENQGKPKIAMDYYFKALEIFEAKNDMKNATTSIFCIGYNYLNQSKYKEAIKYLKRSKELSIQFDNKTSLAYAYMNIGLAYLELNQYDKSLENLENGLKLFTTINDKNNVSYSYNSLSRLHEAMGNHKVSLKYFKEYSTLRDSIYSEESVQKIAEAEVLYQTERKENSIILLTKEKELQNLQLDKQKTFRNYLIAISFLIMALAIIIYSRFIVKRKANKLLEDKNNDLAQKNAQIETQNIKIEAQSEKLKELDEVKSRFFANISHEFRTSLMLIKGPLSDFINEKKTELTDQEMNNLNLSLRNADKLKNLINQLLDLSKLKSGKLLLHTSETNLVSFLKRMIDSFASAGKKMTIEFKTDNNNIPLYFDIGKMETVFTNLLSNAFKFTSENEHITISIVAEENDETAQGSFVIINIADTGLGIKKENLPFIFDRFYQADDSSIKKYEGTGIGLAISKELIELHGGTISVESEIDIGTTFTVLLPKGTDHLSADEMVDIRKEVVFSTPKDAYAPTISSTNIMIDKGNKTKTDNILVVEDNYDMRNYIVSHISENYHIMEASNGKEGLNKAIEHMPSLIISDLMMPEMDGVQFLKEIRNEDKTKDIPFILLTARASEQDRIVGLKAKANDYLTKPFSPEELKTRIHNILETRQHLEEKFSKKILSINFDNPKLISADNEFLQKMRNTVIENIADSSFGINNLIDKAFLSERQLRRKIKDLTGLSPLEFIRQIRLLQAKELLQKQTFNSIAEVSVAVGFSNPHYFSRLYKNMFNESPAEIIY